MTDREMLTKVRDYLVYEDVGDLPADEVEAMTPAYTNALADQIGNAWRMVDDHLQGVKT